MADDDSRPESDPGPLKRYRVAFAATAMLVLGIIVTLPFSLAGVVSDVLGPATGKVFPLLKAPRGAAVEPAFTQLHLSVTAINETQLLATLRVSGHHTCTADCNWKNRILFVSVGSDDAEAEGLPPAERIVLPPASESVSQTVQLPIKGFPIRYPFDTYELVLAVALQRIYPDGRVETVAPDQALRHLSLSIQELLPSQLMSAPVPVDPRSLRAEADPVEYAAAYAVSFERPRHLRVLAIMLVLLIAAAAAYSVFLRPLADLVVNAGALVLGIWGIRAILTPANLYYLTSVDLALSTVILFLLGGITVKALLFAHDQGGLRILRRPARGRRAPGPPGPGRGGQ